jgi:hypothetical protein
VSYISTDSKIKEPHFGHSWRAGSGTIHATVYLSRAGSTFVNFDSPGDARAAAAACTEAAEALERLEAESAALPAKGEGGTDG